MLEKFKLKQSDYEKKNFSASDFGKLGLDLYFRLTGEKESNPTDWYETLKFGAGSGVENQFLKLLKDSDIVDESYDQTVDGRIEVERECGLVTGYIDALAKKELGGFPIEIKSINNKNAFDIKSYAEGVPRYNYIGQLAIYMDAKSSDIGALLVGSIDGLNVFWYEVVKVSDRKYKVTRFKTLESIKQLNNGSVVPFLNDGWINVEQEIIIDLDTEYKRWSSIRDCVEKKELPDIFESVYKYDIESIDWSTLSKDKITKARNNRAVIGDWNILYSNYKDKIVGLQGSQLGYTKEELLRINELTKGYSTWK